MQIEPMLAVPLDKVQISNWSDWAIEEKFDGHRILVRVEPRQANGSQGVHAWSRPRKHAGSSGKTMASRSLPENLIDAFRKLPAGTYDGELLGGETSTDVTRVDLRDRLRFVIFDVMRLTFVDLGDTDVMQQPYSKRRELLEEIFRRTLGMDGFEGIELAESRPLQGKDDVEEFVTRVWSRGGEGGMLKRKAAPYQPGKRSKDVVKVKKLQTEVMTIIGFQASRGEKINRGAFAMVLLRSLDGKRETSVKTLDDAELTAFEAAWCKHAGLTTIAPVPVGVFLGHQERIGKEHPALGRKLRIEFQDWTPKNGYRHPRWDRWENE
jgi:ATP-dependent DNA ligase